MAQNPDRPPGRSWLARISNPAFATARSDQWFGALLSALLVVVAVSVMFCATWFWYLAGAVDLLIAVPTLVHCLVYAIQRRPLN